MNEIMCRQLALDYCCSVEDVADTSNHFSIYYPAEGRRVYKNDDDTILKAAVVDGKNFVFRQTGNYRMVQGKVFRNKRRMVFRTGDDQGTGKQTQ